MGNKHHSDVTGAMHRLKKQVEELQALFNNTDGRTVEKICKKHHKETIEDETPKE